MTYAVDWALKANYLSILLLLLLFCCCCVFERLAMPNAALGLASSQLAGGDKVTRVACQQFHT